MADDDDEIEHRRQPWPDRGRRPGHVHSGAARKDGEVEAARWFRRERGAEPPRDVARDTVAASTNVGRAPTTVRTSCDMSGIAPVAVRHSLERRWRALPEVPARQESSRAPSTARAERAQVAQPCRQERASRRLGPSSGPVRADAEPTRRHRWSRAADRASSPGSPRRRQPNRGRNRHGRARRRHGAPLDRR